MPPPPRWWSRARGSRELICSWTHRTASAKARGLFRTRGRIWAGRGNANQVLARNESADLLPGEAIAALLPLPYGAGDMWRDQSVRCPPKRVAGGQRLRVGHIQRGPDSPRIEDRNQSVRVYRAPPSRIHEQSARLHSRQEIPVHKLLGLWRERQQVHDHVGEGQQIWQCRGWPSVFARVLGNPGHSHAKWLQPRGQRPPDRPMTHDHHTLALEVRGLIVFASIPLGAPLAVDELREPALP